MVNVTVAGGRNDVSYVASSTESLVFCGFSFIVLSIGRYIAGRFLLLIPINQDFMELAELSSPLLLGQFAYPFVYIGSVVIDLCSFPWLSLFA